MSEYTSADHRIQLQYILRNMHTVFALLCFVVVIHWLIYPYPSGLLHWQCGNLTIAPVPAMQPWWIWINTSCEFIMNDCITTTKQSTTKPCAYFLGYTVFTYAMTTLGINKTLLEGEERWCWQITSINTYIYKFMGVFDYSLCWLVKLTSRIHTCQWVTVLPIYHNNVNMKYGLRCQKQVSHAGISNFIPLNTVGCNYLSLPETPASGTRVHKWSIYWIMSFYSTIVIS